MNILNSAVALLILTVVLISFGFWTYTQAAGAEIKACVNTSGAVYVIGDGFKKTTCARGEQLLSWNTIGPKGDKGDAGADGKSAYEIAMNNGFVGSINEWIAGLVGPKGEKGDVGPAGPSGSQIITGSLTYLDGTFSASNGGYFSVETGSIITATVSCPEGKSLLGGGGYAHGYGGGGFGSQAARVALQDSYPSDALTWTVKGVAIISLSSPATSHPMTAQAFAICSE